MQDLAILKLFMHSNQKRLGLNPHTASYYLLVAVEQEKMTQYLKIIATEKFRNKPQHNLEYKIQKEGANKIKKQKDLKQN